MITCNLTKLESAFDQVRKTYPKAKPADAALLASALVITGRHAVALYDGERYLWPSEVENLSRALSGQVALIQETVEVTTKKPAKNAPEEEAVVVTVGLAPNFEAGEKMLGDRKDLKSLLSDMLQNGVEFVYSPTDIGWQWALDRANWSTVTGGDIVRKVKMKASFTEGAVGIEMGQSGPKKRAAKAKAAAELVVETEAEHEIEVAVESMD